METNSQNQRRQKTNLHRIVLGSEARSRVLRWTEQIKKQKYGLNIKPGKVVEFILMAHSEDLSVSEIRAFTEKNIGDIEVAKWLVKELTSAVKRGEKIRLQDLIHPPNSKNTPERSQPKEPKPRKVSIGETSRNDRPSGPEIKTPEPEPKIAFSEGGK